MGFEAGWGLSRFQDFDDVEGGDAEGILDLMAATETAGDNDGIFVFGAEGGEEPVFTDFEAEIAVFVSEGSGHAAASGINQGGLRQQGF